MISLTELKKNVDTINFDLDSYKDKNYLTHNFHPYPAKFIPQIPNQLIKKLSFSNETVLDPFCGCGTTLVEAKLLSRNSIGIDINPLACLISKVKTAVLDDKEISEVKSTLSSIFLDISSLYNTTLDSNHHKIQYNIPNFYNREYWFKNFISEELSIIKAHIEKINDENVKNFLKVAFSSIITPVSNQESDTRYVAVEKKLHPMITIKLFSSKVNDMIVRIQKFKNLCSNCYSKVYHHSSRNISFLDDNSLDLVITSPPYLNSYDYYLYHKHRMQWLDMDYRYAQEYEIGSRHKHSDKNESVDTYANKIGDVLYETNRVLKDERYCCIVIGDAIKNGKLIKMNEIMDSIAIENGFKKRREIIFDQRKYTKAFTKNIKKTHKNSYILIYQKS